MLVGHEVHGMGWDGDGMGLAKYRSTSLSQDFLLQSTSMYLAVFQY